MTPPSDDTKAASQTSGAGRAVGMPEAFTGIPNPYIDWEMAQCTGAEVKVVLYIARRTLGSQWSRANGGWDEISLSQFCDGIVKTDGTRFDRGTGLGRQAVVEAIRRLLVAEIIERKPGDGRRADSYRIDPRLMVAQPLPSKTVATAPNHRYENQTATGTKIKPQGGMKIEPLAVRKSHEQNKASSRSTEREQESLSLPEKAEQRRAKNRRSDSSRRLDDETPGAPEVFENPPDELRAIYFRKTGRQISPALRREFFETIELQGIPIADAMQELRHHVPSAWHNPDGFLTYFAKNIRSKMPEFAPAPQAVKAEVSKIRGPCPKCRGGGRILELIEGQRPRQTDRYCDCPQGKEIDATERRIRSSSATAKNEKTFRVDRARIPPVAAVS